MYNIDEGLASRAKLVKNMRAILDAADAEKRGMTSEDTQTYERMAAEVDQITQRVKLETETRQHEETIARITGRPVIPQSADEDAVRKEVRAAVQRGFHHYLTREIGAPPDPETTKEFRALSQGVATEGGYLVPHEFAAQLIEDVKNETFVLQGARVWPLSKASEIQFPVLDARLGAIQWGGELTQPNLDSTLAFGQRTLTPRHGMLRLQVSRKLVRNSAIPLEDLIRAEFAYAQAIGIEQALITGVGGYQPLGFMVASASGVSTARDYSTGNTTTAITFDNLIGQKYNIKPQYYPRLCWCFHRSVMREVAKLKDGVQRYLWQPSQQAGQPDTLLGFPLRQSEYMPNTMTSGLYVGALCDWSRYYVTIGLDMELQRLDEIAARTNQVEYILRFEIDGAPVREEAFSRVQLA